MSANATRLRKTATSTDADGVDHSKPRDEPQGRAVKRTPVSKFTGQLVLAVIAVSAFYVWRLSLQSAEVGGWWNLMTGHKPLATPIAEQKASASAASAVSSAQATGTAAPGGSIYDGADTVESQILRLAGSLGVKPRQLTEAIAPLLSPTLLSDTDGAIHSDLTEEEELAAAEQKHEHEQHHGGVTGAVAGVVGGVGSLVDALAD